MMGHKTFFLSRNWRGDSLAIEMKGGNKNEIRNY